MHRERAASRSVRCIDPDLDLDAAGVRHDQGLGQGELVQHRATDFVTRPDRQVHQDRRGQQPEPGHGLAVQPGVGRRGDPPGEQVAVTVGEPNARAQHRMPQRVLARRSQIGGLGGRRGVRPVPLVLEGVGGQRGREGVQIREGRPPVDGDAVDVNLGEGGQQTVGTALPAPQRAHDQGVPAGVVQRLLDPEPCYRVRAHLDEHADSGGQQRAGGPLEQHRLAGVGVPVLGVHAGGVQQLSGDRRVEGDPRSGGRDRAQEVHQLRTDTVHLSTVGGDR